MGIVALSAFAVVLIFLALAVTAAVNYANGMRSSSGEFRGLGVIIVAWLIAAMLIFSAWFMSPVHAAAKKKKVTHPHPTSVQIGKTALPKEEAPLRCAPIENSMAVVNCH